MFAAMRCVFVLLWLSLAILHPQVGFSQKRFKAGLLAGMTASQIDGDRSAGFLKVGWQAGGRGIVRLKPKQEASVELLYTQRGSRNEAYALPLFSLTLHYVEIPVQWHYFDWGVYGPTGDDPLFYRVQLNAGLSYAQLLNYREPFNESGIQAALPHLNTSSVSALLGATFFATQHIGFTARYQRGLNWLYRPGKSGGNFAYSLRERFLVFQLMYVF